jgi:hypothetical protein
MASILAEAVERRSKTWRMLEPCCMLMILSWSSSLTQTRKVLASLWKIPRPSGQSFSRPQDCRYLSPPLNRKWSAMSYFFSASVMVARE